MNYKKIHIIGGPGSGKTFCATKLSEELGIKAYDLDNVFWNSEQTEYIKSSEYERANKLSLISKQKSWIIEGVYYKWLSDTFEEADLIIILETPLYKRQLRILKRFVLQKYFIPHDKDETFPNFVELWQWNKVFDKENLIQIKHFIKKHKNKTVTCRAYDEILSAIKT